MSWTSDVDGRVRTCNGSEIVYGKDTARVVSTSYSPKQVREVIHASVNEPLLELPDYRDDGVSVFVDPRHIIAIVPRWLIKDPE